MQSKPAPTPGGRNHAATLQLDAGEHSDLHLAAVGNSKSALIRACICPKRWRKLVQLPAQQRRRQIAGN